MTEEISSIATHLPVGIYYIVTMCSTKLLDIGGGGGMAMCLCADGKKMRELKGGVQMPDRKIYKFLINMVNFVVIEDDDDDDDDKSDGFALSLR